MFPNKRKMQSGYPLALPATFVCRQFAIFILLEIDQAPNKRFSLLMPQRVNVAGITEQLKAADQMRWVSLMNTVKAQVEEIIFAE